MGFLLALALISNRVLANAHKEVTTYGFQVEQQGKGDRNIERRAVARPTVSVF
jgi:hypothetical protein